MKKYNDNVMTPLEYKKIRRNKVISLAMRRKRKGKVSNKRIEELKKEKT